jgi:malate dehydrogenase
MQRVSIIGSGNVGTNLAFFIAENRSASVTLVDIKPGMSTGKALDLMEAGPLRGYNTKIRGADALDAVEGSNVVVIAAGRVRRPGEHRVDLYRDNASTVEQICLQVRKLAPGAVVVNVAEPVDLLTLLAQETLGFDRLKVLGVGGLLSSTRIRYLVSHALGVSPREVTALVIGPHHHSMIFLRNTIRVAGIPVSSLMPADQLDSLIEEARGAGDTILKMAQRMTAYYGPAAAVAGLIEAIVRDTRAVLPVSVRCQGEYDINNLCIGVPAYIGARGAEKIIELELSEEEGSAFEKAAEGLKVARRQVAGDSSVL